MSDKEINNSWVVWLGNEKTKRLKAIRSWEIKARRTNITDSIGRNPIDVLRNDVNSINSLIDLCDNQQITEPIACPLCHSGTEFEAVEMHTCKGPACKHKFIKEID